VDLIIIVILSASFLVKNDQRLNYRYGRYYLIFLWEETKPLELVVVPSN